MSKSAVDVANEERAKRHMLRDYQDQGKVSVALSMEDVDRRFPWFWNSGKMRPEFTVIEGGGQR